VKLIAILPCGREHEKKCIRCGHSDFHEDLHPPALYGAGTKVYRCDHCGHVGAWSVKPDIRNGNFYFDMRAVEKAAGPVRR
jgi:hypothetical protein